MRLPNLFRLEKRHEALMLYDRLVSGLVFAGRYEEAVAAARAARHVIRRAGRWNRGGLMFNWEIEALLALKRPKDAWRAYRAWVRSQPNAARLRTLEGRVRYAESMVRYCEAPVLFTLGKFAEGARATEACLSREFRSHPERAFDSMYAVMNDDPTPTHPARTTLAHFYAAMGKSLSEWEDWNAWVRALPAPLFKFGGVDRRTLTADPNLLPQFLARIRDERSRRLEKTHLSHGLADLKDPAAKVERRQRRLAAQLEKERARAAARSAEVAAKMARYFPFL